MSNINLYLTVIMQNKAWLCFETLENQFTVCIKNNVFIEHNASYKGN